MTQQTFQCQSCQGVYFDTSPDGGSYHHVCPLIAPDDSAKAVERPNRRDENLVMAGRGRAIGIKAEGAGVKCLTLAQISEPRWIARIKADTAKATASDE